MTIPVATVLEVVSDISGAVSGFALLVPTYRILSARELLRERIDAIRARARAANIDAEDLVRDLLEADQATSQYDRRDARLIKAGAWAFLLSFLLRLVYHWITKVPGSGA